MKKFFKFYRTNFISLLFIAIFFTSQLQPAFSGEFSSAVESSRSETEAQEEEKTVSTSSSESEDNSLIVFLAKIAGVFWYYNTFTVRYTSFPYKYENLTYMKWAETETNPEAKTKSKRYDEPINGEWREINSEPINSGRSYINQLLLEDKKHK